MVATVTNPTPLGTGFRLFTGEQLNGLFANPIYGSTDNITATAGGGQTGAYQLTTPNARVTTVASANDSVKLPKSVPGMEWSVMNSGANSLNVFPAAGEQINGGGANNAQAVGAGKMAILVCYTAGSWIGPVTLA